MDDHLSGPAVASRLKRLPGSATGRRRAQAPMLPYQSCTRWGLQSGQVAMPLVSSYLAFPPLRPSCIAAERVAVYLCCTFLGVASTGSYPAPCPMELGLSSRAQSACDRPATLQPGISIPRTAENVKQSFPSLSYLLPPNHAIFSISSCSWNMILFSSLDI